MLNGRELFKKMDINFDQLFVPYKFTISNIGNYSIKKFNLSKSTDIDDLDTIKEDVVIYSNNIILAPSFPYILDKNNKRIKIPEILFEDIIELIQDKIGTIEYIL